MQVVAIVCAGPDDISNHPPTIFMLIRISIVTLPKIKNSSKMNAKCLFLGLLSICRSVEMIKTSHEILVPKDKTDSVWKGRLICRELWVQSDLIPSPLVL